MAYGIREDYLAWKSLGKGGLRHDFLGYAFIQTLGLLRSRDLRSVDCYDELTKRPLEGRTFIHGELPARTYERPSISTWAAPVRQLSDGADEALIQASQASLSAIAAANPTFLTIAPSKLEGGYSSALFLKPQPGLPLSATSTPPTKGMRTRVPDEIYHVHYAEGSAHCTLSCTDAKILIERGWGERQCLSGRVPGLPLNYVMMYAPRNDDEVRMHAMVARAAARYALEGMVEVV